MEKIHMVDLKGQYNKIRDEINIAINEVIESTSFIKGPVVKTFEESLASFLKVKHVIACGNGTDALQLALMSLNLKPGDEVITPDFTFIATVEVIALLGLKPVLVDVDRATFNIKTESLKRAITTKTKAIIPVHLFGQCANMEAILEIAKQKDIFVIEDSAQSLGSEYTYRSGNVAMAGTMGHIGTTSFFPSKNLGGYGDGGAIFTNDDNLAEEVRALANHGMRNRYYHDTIGVNSRLDSLQAAILNVKLKYLPEYNFARQKAANFYNNAFKDNPLCEIPYKAGYSTHIFHQYTLKLNGVDRDKFREYLAGQNIPAMIYYPVPLHKQKAFQKFSTKTDFYPVTDELCDIVLSLPMHTELNDEQLQYISEKVFIGLKKCKNE